MNRAARDQLQLAELIPGTKRVVGFFILPHAWGNSVCVAPCPSTQALKSHTYASGDGCLCVWEAMQRDEVRSGRQHHGLLKPQTTRRVHVWALAPATNPHRRPVHACTPTRLTHTATRGPRWAGRMLRSLTWPRWGARMSPGASELPPLGWWTAASPPRWSAPAPASVPRSDLRSSSPGLWTPSRRLLRRSRPHTHTAGQPGLCCPYPCCCCSSSSRARGA